jgi:hypothetical protein
MRRTEWFPPLSVQSNVYAAPAGNDMPLILYIESNSRLKKRKVLRPCSFATRSAASATLIPILV